MHFTPGFHTILLFSQSLWYFVKSSVKSSFKTTEANPLWTLPPTQGSTETKLHINTLDGPITAILITRPNVLTFPMWSPAPQRRVYILRTDHDTTRKWETNDSVWTKVVNCIHSYFLWSVKADRHAHLKLQVVLFQSVFIYLLGFDLLVWWIGSVLSQLCGDVLQLCLMGFELLLLQHNKVK